MQSWVLPEISYYLVENIQFLKKGHKVRAIGRDPKKLEALKLKGAEILAVTDFSNKEALVDAFKGVDAIFSFLPPDYMSEDYRLAQDKIGEAIKTSILKNNISHVLNLSSIGGNLPEGTGPIVGT